MLHILNEVKHRPWQLPQGRWRYYQEWNEALFLHWKIPLEILRPLVPQELEIDQCDGNSWISVVVFKMENIRLRGLPSFSPVSNFYEINLRTYVVSEGKRGVYFLNIEAEKAISAFVSQNFSGLPYEKAKMSWQVKEDLISFRSINKSKGFKLDVAYVIGHPITKSMLDTWLTERYCLYLKEKGDLYRYEIHHPEWEVNTVKLRSLEVSYELEKWKIASEMPDCVHYSKGVRVLAWQRKVCLNRSSC